MIAPQVLCGHCGDRHTIPGVAICAAIHHNDSEVSK